MHDPPLVIENKLRGLNKVAFFLPPGAYQIALLAGYIVGYRKGQVGPDFRCLFTGVMARRHDRGTQLGERVEAFSVAV